MMTCVRRVRIQWVGKDLLGWLIVYREKREIRTDTAKNTIFNSLYFSLLRFFFFSFLIVYVSLSLQYLVHIYVPVCTIIAQTYEMLHDE